MTVVGRIAPPRPPVADDLVLTRKEVARRLGMAPKRVASMGLPVIRLGHRTVRYLWSDVLAYLRGRSA